MRAIILAAGLGGRLGARTESRPKAALQVGGRPLLDYAIAFARHARATRIFVVAGHEVEQTERLARQLGADDVVFNARFREAGNLVSLNVARRAGSCAGAFLIMNCDHIYRPAIGAEVARVTREAAHVTAFIDGDRALGADDMKVRLDSARRVVAIDKQLETWDAGYVGMTFVPEARIEEYFYTADNVARERGDLIPVEAVLHRMAGVNPAATADVSGHGWLEVDTEDDLAAADAATAGGAWYASARP